jgi:ribosome biogenesis GTPase A
MEKKMNATEQKLEVLKESVEKVKAYVQALCDIRSDIYSIKRTEWLEKINEMERIVNEDAILMFIGPFSSGKSSFVNALLGEEILPTANTPCTAVVTEISFINGGGDSGEIYRRDNPEKPEIIEIEELKKIINGPSGASGEVASYHHVKLNLDVTDNDNRKQFLPFVNKIRIIDCPGYGSPYFANEDIIVDYIEKASFTFWMTPYNKIGGAEAEKHLSLIKKNTSTLIPLITKADLIPDEEEKENIKEDYYEQISSYFHSREPHFVSANKFRDAVIYEKKIKKDGKDTDKKFEELRIASGIDWVKSAMQDCATVKNTNEKKVDSMLFDIRGLLKEISDLAGKEKQHWEIKLSEFGWNPNEQKYEKFDAIKERIERWIKEEARKTSDSLKNELSAKLINIFDGKNNETVTSEIRECWLQTINKKKDSWCIYLKKQYEEYIKTFVPQIESSPLNISLTGNMFVQTSLNLFDALLESLKNSGPTSILEASGGAAMLMSIPLLQAVEAPIKAKICAIVATIFGVSGPALIAVAVIPLIPTIRNLVKQKNEFDKVKRQNQIRNIIETLDVTPVIEGILEKTHKEVCNTIIKYLNSDCCIPKQNYDNCKKILEEVLTELKNLDVRFSVKK